MVISASIGLIGLGPASRVYSYLLAPTENDTINSRNPLMHPHTIYNVLE